MQQHPGQRVAVALAAGEHADPLEDVVVGKQEAAEQAAQFGLAGARRRFSKIVEDAGVGIEFLVLILREVVGFDVVAQAVFAVRRRLSAGEQFDQRGLARAVDADQGDAVSALDS